MLQLLVPLLLPPCLPSQAAPLSATTPPASQASDGNVWEVCPEARSRYPAETNISVAVKSDVRLCVHAEIGAVELWGAYEDYDRPLFHAFDRYVSRSTVVLDLGAWIGMTTLYLAKRGGAVVALEPSLTAYSQLMDNVELNLDVENRVQVVNAALGSYDGLMYFTNTGNAMDRPVAALWLEDFGVLRALLLAIPSLKRGKFVDVTE